MDRMTDERLAEIRKIYNAMEIHQSSQLIGELLQALKAERKCNEELEARIDKALKHLPERPGMAMGFLLDEQKEVHYQRLTAVEDLTLLENDDE